MTEGNREGGFDVSKLDPETAKLYRKCDLMRQCVGVIADHLVNGSRRSKTPGEFGPAEQDYYQNLADVFIQLAQDCEPAEAQRIIASSLEQTETAAWMHNPPRVPRTTPSTAVEWAEVRRQEAEATEAQLRNDRRMGFRR